MTDSEKITKLIEANSRLRGEICGVSGQVSGMSMWCNDAEASVWLKKVEGRLDEALKQDDKAVSKIIFG